LNQIEKARSLKNAVAVEALIETPLGMASGLFTANKKFATT